MRTAGPFAAPLEDGTLSQFERISSMDEFDRLAIDTAFGVLAADIESPGSQEPGNIEAARQIVELSPGAAYQRGFSV